MKSGLNRSARAVVAGGGDVGEAFVGTAEGFVEFAEKSAKTETGTVREGRGEGGVTGGD